MSAVLVLGETWCADDHSHMADLVWEPGTMLQAPLCFECAEARLDRCEVPPGQLAVLDRIRGPQEYRPLVERWGDPSWAEAGDEEDL